MTIVTVHQQPSGLFIVTDSDGVKYATKDSIRASVADRMRIKGAKVRLLSSAGWHYRELHSVIEVREPVQRATLPVPAGPQCADRCRWYRASAYALKCRRCGWVKAADDHHGIV